MMRLLLVCTALTLALAGCGPTRPPAVQTALDSLEQRFPRPTAGSQPNPVLVDLARTAETPVHARREAFEPEVSTLIELGYVDHLSITLDLGQPTYAAPVFGRMEQWPTRALRPDWPLRLHFRYHWIDAPDQGGPFVNGIHLDGFILSAKRERLFNELIDILDDLVDGELTLDAFTIIEHPPAD